MVNVIPDFVSVIIQMINFLILIFLLNIVLYTPIRNILEKRAIFISQLKKDIEDNMKVIQDKKYKLEIDQVELYRSGSILQTELRNEGREREREIIQTAKVEMESLVAKMRIEVASEREKAYQELKKEVKYFGIELAQKFLGRSI